MKKMSGERKRKKNALMHLSKKWVDRIKSYISNFFNYYILIYIKITFLFPHIIEMIDKKLNFPKLNVWIVVSPNFGWKIIIWQIILQIQKKLIILYI